MTEPRIEPLVGDKGEKKEKQPIPQELQELPVGRYALVFNNGVTEFWSKREVNVLNDQGERTGEKVPDYSSPEDFWDASENGCDGISYRYAAEKSRDLTKYKPMKVNRDHPNKQEVPIERIPIQDWSDIHVFLQGRRQDCFTIMNETKDYGEFSVRVTSADSDYGLLKKIELIDNETSQPVSISNFQEWLDKNGLSDYWDNLEKYAD